MSVWLNRQHESKHVETKSRMHKNSLCLRLYCHSIPAQSYASNQRVLSEKAVKDAPRSKGLQEMDAEGIPKNVVVIDVDDSEATSRQTKENRTETSIMSDNVK